MDPDNPDHTEATYLYRVWSLKGTSIYPQTPQVRYYITALTAARDLVRAGKPAFIQVTLETD